MGFNPHEPYNDLPLLPPKGKVQTEEVLKKCISATRSLAQLKGAGSLVPNQSILINSIPLQEAKDSSEIENIVTTQDDLYQAEVSESNVSSPHTKEVLRYRTALKKGYEMLSRRPISTNLIIEICRTVLDTDIDIRKVPGTKLENPDTKKIVYTPPEGEEIIRRKLHNLEIFINEDNGLDPLVKLAIIHYQFEAIHPFGDGNGRTGRILNILYLVEQKLLEIPVLYLSRYIINNRNEYYKRLKGVTEKSDWEPWILYILDAVDKTSLETCEKIVAIKDLMAETIDFCRENLPKRVYSKELVELLFVQPYCKISFLVEADIAKRQSASEYLKELEKIGILVGEKKGRETIYKHPKLLDILST